MAYETAVAHARNLRISARKLNLQAQMIRGLPVAKALDALAFARQRIAKDVYQVLLSAIANAENNYGMDIDRLCVDEAYVGQGFALRRFHARAKGRGAPIRKYFSHLTITVRESED